MDYLIAGVLVKSQIKNEDDLKDLLGAMYTYDDASTSINEVLNLEDNKVFFIGRSEVGSVVFSKTLIKNIKNMDKETLRFSLLSSHSSYMFVSSNQGKELGEYVMLNGKVIENTIPNYDFSELKFEEKFEEIVNEFLNVKDFKLLTYKRYKKCGFFKRLFG